MAALFHWQPEPAPDFGTTAMLAQNSTRLGIGFSRLVVAGSVLTSIACDQTA